MALLIAHRGGAKEAFENSPAAFRHAVKCGAGSIEADLRATRDGKIVILHDAGLKRVTTGDGKLKNFTFNQIRHVKLKNRELVPTLPELLKFSKNKIMLHLEIKEPGFEGLLVKTLREFGMTGSVFVISFYPGILRRVHGLDPKIKTGFLYAVPGGDFFSPEFCRILLPLEKLLSRGLIRRLHAQGKKIHTWVVNDAARAKELVSLGVDGIATDVPQALAPIFSKF